MSQQPRWPPAVHYEFHGDGVKGVLGMVPPTPQRTVTVDGTTINDPTGEHISIETTRIGWTARVHLDSAADRHTRSVWLVLPHVNTEGGTGAFEGIAIVVTHRTSIGGPSLVKGPLEEYDIRQVSGSARPSLP